MKPPKAYYVEERLSFFGSLEAEIQISPYWIGMVELYMLNCNMRYMYMYLRDVRV